MINCAISVFHPKWIKIQNNSQTFLITLTHVFTSFWAFPISCGILLLLISHIILVLAGLFHNTGSSLRKNFNTVCSSVINYKFHKSNSRIAPGAFVPELLPKRGSVFDAKHTGAQGAGQSPAAAASRHTGSHAVFRSRALRDEVNATGSRTQSLRLGFGSLHAASLLSHTTWHNTHSVPIDVATLSSSSQDQRHWFLTHDMWLRMTSAQFDLLVETIPSIT